MDEEFKAKRADFATGLIDSISGFFLDHCPEGVNWENFDPDLDQVRTDLQQLNGEGI